MELLFIILTYQMQFYFAILLIFNNLSIFSLELNSHSQTATQCLLHVKIDQLVDHFNFDYWQFLIRNTNA